MSYRGGKGPKQGWYRLVNKNKFIKPVDSFMKSFNESEGTVEYKSSLELKSFRYCDMNPSVKAWSCEPFAIKYIKPTDNKVHRYFIDLLIEFNSGKKFLVEIKSSSETMPPKVPRNKTQKAMMNYQKAIITWNVNQAKWAAAKHFCDTNNMQFKMLTEKELN